MGNIFSFRLPRLSWYEHYVTEIHFIRLEENSFSVRLHLPIKSFLENQQKYLGADSESKNSVSWSWDCLPFLRWFCLGFSLSVSEQAWIQIRQNKCPA